MDPVTLEHVAQDAQMYPVELLEGRSNGLLLFAAAFLGVNDAIHFAIAGLDATLVDVDAARLEEMRALYRDDRWRWIVGDAWAFAREARDAGAKWDVVSVDTFTGDAERRSLDDLEAWTSLARHAVTVTATRDAAYRVPRRWTARILPRSPSAYWLVLERRS
jgi:hypothetical protein